MATINIRSGFESERPTLQQLMQDGLYLVFVSGINCDGWRAYEYREGKLLRQTSIPCYERESLKQIIDQYPGKVYGFNVGYYMFSRKWEPFKDSYQPQGVSEIIRVDLVDKVYKISES